MKSNLHRQAADERDSRHGGDDDTMNSIGMPMNVGMSWFAIQTNTRVFRIT